MISGTYPNLAKNGVQVVGFGNTLTTAFEAGSDGENGRFKHIVNASNSMSTDGIFLATWQPVAGRGIEWSNTSWTNGIMSAKTNGVGTGLIFDAGEKGQIYGETEGSQRWMVISIGDYGLKIRKENGGAEVMRIDRSGDVKITGRLFVNGVQVNVP